MARSKFPWAPCPEGRREKKNRESKEMSKRSPSPLWEVVRQGWLLGGELPTVLGIKSSPSSLTRPCMSHSCPASPGSSSPCSLQPTGFASLGQLPRTLSPPHILPVAKSYSSFWCQDTCSFFLEASRLYPVDLGTSRPLRTHAPASWLVFLNWVSDRVHLLRFSQVPLPALLDSATLCHPHLHFHPWVKHHALGRGLWL